MKFSRERDLYLVIDLVNPKNSEIVTSRDKVANLCKVHRNTVKGVPYSTYLAFMVLMKHIN